LARYCTLAVLLADDAAMIASSRILFGRRVDRDCCRVDDDDGDRGREGRIIRPPAMDNASQQQQRRRQGPSKEEEEEYVRNMMQRRARGRVIDAILARGTIERSGSLSLQAERR
jgi:hypothetical protein